MRVEQHIDVAEQITRWLDLEPVQRLIRLAQERWP